jgi:hypothetical protein
MSRTAFETPDAHRVLALACQASAVVTVVLGVAYGWALHRTVSAAREHARSEAARAATVIDAELRSFQTVVGGVVDDVASGRVARGAIVARLRSAVDETPQLSGIGAAFLPLAYDPALRLYAPYYQRSGDGAELVQLDSLYDYTQKQYEWYHKPLESGPSWSEPAVSAAQGAPVVEYSAPFRLASSASKSPTGVVHATMSLNEIEGLVTSLDLGEFGYGFLVSKGGFLISHPFAEEYAPERRAAATRGAQAEKMLGGLQSAKGPLVSDAIDPITGEPCWLFTEPVPSAGWTVGVVFFKGLSARNRLIRRQEIRFAVSLIVTLSLLLALALEPYRRSHDVLTLWAGSVIGSLILAFGIGWLWSIGYYGPDSAPGSGRTAFVDKASVRKFVLDATRRTLKRTGDLPIFVPTGVFIQTLEVVSPNNVTMTGYVWQKYAKNLPPSVTRGFTLPDSVEGSIVEAYRRSDGETETIGWRVKAVIRQDFDYSGYPLDQQDFKLRLWHSDLDGRVVLVPDLDSYRIIHPLARAGLESDFKLPGWNVERTQFSSRVRDRTTTFGVDAGRRNGDTELSFDVMINRHILEPVFSSLLPLAVSAFMAFVLMLMIKESSRPNVVQALAAYSALFFVIILSQLDLRRRVSGTSILYIEYFYFATYGALIAAALVTLTNGWPGHFPQIEQREHFYPKLLFWPAMMTVLAVITICAFY